MARPVSESKATSVNVYFPGGNSEVWYDIDDFKSFPGTGTVTVPVSLDKVLNLLLHNMKLVLVVLIFFVESRILPWWKHNTPQGASTSIIGPYTR